MKVLVVVARDGRNPTSAGGDQHLTLLAQEIASWGHEVTLWCSSRPSLPREERYEGILVRRVAPLPLLAPAVWGHFLTGGARRYDLVIEDLVGGARLPFGAAILARRPHAGMWFQDNRPLFRETYREPLARLAGAVQAGLLRIYRDGWAFVPSEATRAWVVAEGMDPSRVVVYPRREPIPFPGAGLRPFDGRRNRIVCIGNLRPLKRVHESIEVLARLRGSVPDVELLIVGRASDPAYARRLEERSQAPDVRDAVEIRRDVPESEKHEILALAKVVTVHSPIEGLAWTVIEAGAFGVPAVANVGVPEEVVVEGRNGRRLPIGDLDGYAEAIRRLLTDRDEWTRLSDGARAVAGRFTRAGSDPGLRRWVESIPRAGSERPHRAARPGEPPATAAGSP